MTKKKVSAQLKKARALVNKGWCKGRLETIRDGKCSYCAVGGLVKVCSENVYGLAMNEFYWPGHNYLISALKQIDPPHYGGSLVESYNDHPKTTKKDILDLYSVAIQLAQKDEASSR